MEVSMDPWNREATLEMLQQMLDMGMGKPSDGDPRGKWMQPEHRATLETLLEEAPKLSDHEVYTRLDDIRRWHFHGGVDNIVVAALWPRPHYTVPERTGPLPSSKTWAYCKKGDWKSLSSLRSAIQIGVDEVTRLEGADDAVYWPVREIDDGVSWMAL